MRFHLPPVSFIGYLRRRVPIPCSRTAAPFAQCEPRFSGESKSGSCPVHTPFCTSAITPQPTEQWVQMLRRISVATPSFGPVAALDLAHHGRRQHRRDGRAPHGEAGAPEEGSPSDRIAWRRDMDGTFGPASSFE